MRAPSCRRAGEASLNDNTVDGTQTADSVIALIRDPGATLALNLFNNSVSHGDGAGFRLDDFGGGTLTLLADANNSYANADPDDFAGQPAGTVTSVDPGYVDAAGGDLRLAPGSLLIDAGIDAPPGGTSTYDAAGASRIAGAAIDVGAYEAPDPGAAALGLATLGALGVLARRARGGACSGAAAAAGMRCEPAHSPRAGGGG